MIGVPRGVELPANGAVTDNAQSCTGWIGRRKERRMKCGSFIAWRIAISGTAVPSSAPFTTILHSRSLTLAAKAVKSPTWSLKNIDFPSASSTSRRGYSSMLKAYCCHPPCSSVGGPLGAHLKSSLHWVEQLSAFLSVWRMQQCDGIGQVFTLGQGRAIICSHLHSTRVYDRYMRIVAVYVTTCRRTPWLILQQSHSSRMVYFKD